MRERRLAHSAKQLRVMIAILTLLKWKRREFGDPIHEWINRVDVLRKANVDNGIFDEVIKRLEIMKGVEFLACVTKKEEWWSFRLLPQGERYLEEEVRPFLDAAGELR